MTWIVNHKTALVKDLDGKVLVVLKRGYSWNRKTDERTRTFANKEVALANLKNARRYRGPEASE